MFNILYTYLKKKRPKIKASLKCNYLLLKNLLLIREIKLKSVIIYDRVIIENNEIEVLWNVTGCHKIKIKGLGIFPGNIHGVKFQFNNFYNPLEITFWGVSKQLKKKIKVENTKINLLNKFYATSEIPITIGISVPYIKKKFDCSIIKNNITLEQQNIYLEFEPFNLNNYKPVNTIQ
jgi:hypothetical protein